MNRSAPTILFVEDELSLVRSFEIALQRLGYQVLATSDPEEALRLIQTTDHIDVAVLDLQLPMDGVASFSSQETMGGREAGLAIARELRRKFLRAPVIFWSLAAHQKVRSQVHALGNAVLIHKLADAQTVVEAIEHAVEGFRAGNRPRSFLVHGHDEATMSSVKQFLASELGFPAPIVLRDEPSHGRTLIEKLESYAFTVDLVFVLLTPDDRVVSATAGEAERYRSRQNVIFEMGYFLGFMGRSTGRVILLFRQPIELPSDTHGMIHIDITDGIESASAQLRAELSEWL